MLNITRERLSSWETARSPISWNYGFGFCLALDISVRWLAVGEGQWDEELDWLPVANTLEAPLRMPFGEAYARYIAPAYEIKEKAPGNSVFSKTSDPKRIEAMKELLRSYPEKWIGLIPDEDIEDFTLLLWKVFEEFKTNKLFTRFERYKDRLLGRHK